MTARLISEFMTQTDTDRSQIKDAMTIGNLDIGFLAKFAIEGDGETFRCRIVERIGAARKSQPT